jgi:hypothetical protein
MGMVRITAAISSSAKSCLGLPEQAEIGCDDEPTRIAACDAYSLLLRLSSVATCDACCCECSRKDMVDPSLM